MDDPWVHIVKVVLDSGIRTGRYINSLLANNVDDVTQGKNTIKLSISNSISSRRLTYKTLNPDFTVDKVYCERSGVKEVHRLAYSQFRVSGHWLAIETGRWNRRGRGRLPIEERLCPCGAIQTELHVLEECPLTDSVRTHYGFESWQQLMHHPELFSAPQIIYAI